MLGAASKADCKKLNRLSEKVRGRSPMVVAFSGGVDSSLVAKLAYLSSKKSIAVTIASPTLPKAELEGAVKIARGIGIRHIIIRTNRLGAELSRNDSLRCYYCKKQMLGLLKGVADKEHIQTIADGANKDDLGEFRPGIMACREAGAYSPLLESGLSKNDVRRLALLLRLPNYDKPAAACLASRFKSGVGISLKGLEKVERAEQAVSGITKLAHVRVRDQGDTARIEVDRERLGELVSNRKLGAMVKKLKALGYKHITVDLEGYKVGGG